MPAEAVLAADHAAEVATAREAAAWAVAAWAAAAMDFAMERVEMATEAAAEAAEVAEAAAEAAMARQAAAPAAAAAVWTTEVAAVSLETAAEAGKDAAMPPTKRQKRARPTDTSGRALIDAGEFGRLQVQEGTMACALKTFQEAALQRWASDDGSWEADGLRICDGMPVSFVSNLGGDNRLLLDEPTTLAAAAVTSSSSSSIGQSDQTDGTRAMAQASMEEAAQPTSPIVEKRAR